MTGPLRLAYSAISDVGRIRRDNQDSGYAGPWLLTVCDGVGGAARGDLASSTAVQPLRKLDAEPSDDLLALVAGAIHRADDRIGELVDEDPELNGTSTTATVVLFDGERLGVGHLGDSRAYLLRGGELRRLTHDHTFVQSLIDEGRITEEQSRMHPHRNLILKALDGIRHEEPDLFEVPVEVGDRLFVCSDGACGSLDDDRMADILGSGNADYAAVELVRASLEAGSSDNVTCVVADVVDTEPDPDLAAAARRRGRRPAPPAPQRRRRPRPASAATAPATPARSTRCPSRAQRPARRRARHPLRPDRPRGRSATRPARRPATPGSSACSPTCVLLGLAWVALASAWSWSQQPVLRRRLGRQDDDLPRPQRRDPRHRHLAPLRDQRRRRRQPQRDRRRAGHRRHRGHRPRRRPRHGGQLRRPPGRARRDGAG